MPVVSIAMGEMTTRLSMGLSSHNGGDRDIFDLWQQGLALNSFTEYINSLYPTIKFELVYRKTNLMF